MNTSTTALMTAAPAVSAGDIDEFDTEFDRHAWRDAAECRDAEVAQVFQHRAMDYDPADEDYKGLTDAEHAEAAASKAILEVEAKSHCMGCPVIASCLEFALVNDVAGVAGGKTEDERVELRETHGIEVVDVMGEFFPERGARDQIDDKTVKRLSALEWTTEEIADYLGCAPRTVIRARKRIKAAEAAEGVIAEANATIKVTVNADGTVGVVEPKQPVSTGVDTSDPLAGIVDPFAGLVPVKGVVPAEADPVAAPVAEVDETGADENIDEAFPAPGKPLASPSKISDMMAAVYDLLADGKVHSEAEIVTAGAAKVAAGDAEAFWVTSQSRGMDNNGQVILSVKAQKTPVSDRRAAGARMKVLNAVKAAARPRNGHIELAGGGYRVTGMTLASWNEHRGALASA